jgi:hypothetical protein
MNPEKPTHKNIFFSYKWLRKYFLPTHFVNPAQDYYICKPIAGLLITSVNFFQDGSDWKWPKKKSVKKICMYGVKK